MPTITGIEEKRGQVEILADGVVVLRVRRTHFAKCPLRVGDEYDPDDYLPRLAAVQFPDAWEAALSCLDASERSAKEIENSLRRKGYVPPAIEAAVARLRECGLIDDARYARRMAELQSQKPVGRYAFRRRLRARGISDDDAEEALAAFDDDQQRDACRAAAEQLLRKYAALPPREGRAKLSQALARRGFGWDAIEYATEGLFEE